MTDQLPDEVARLTDEVLRLNLINKELLDVAADALYSMEMFECDSRGQIPRLRTVIERAKRTAKAEL